MAFYGSWGMFIHMPFSGGTWMKRQLRQLERGSHVGTMHGLPVTEWAYNREFMLIRPIPEWYRSAHGYMSPKWRCGGTESELWNTINAKMVHCKDNNFDKWMENIFDKYPGLASWVYGCYAAPGTELVHLDDVELWLKAELDIDVKDAPFNTHKDEKLEISPRVFAMCAMMEDPHWWRLTRSGEKV